MIAAALVLAGCAGQTEPEARPGAMAPGGAVAFVADGVPVPEAAIDALVARIPRQQARELEEDGGRTAFVEHVALTQALYQRALEADLDADPEVRLVLAMGQREVLAAEHVRREAQRRVTPEAVARRYEQTPGFHVRQARLRHIRLRQGADPAEIFGRLSAGEPFAEVARALSADAGTAPEGGDLGWIDVSVVERTFGPEVAGAPEGEVSGPIEAKVGGTHIVLIEAIRTSIPLGEVEEGLAASMRSEMAEQLVEEQRAALRIERPAP